MRSAFGVVVFVAMCLSACSGPAADPASGSAAPPGPTVAPSALKTQIVAACQKQANDVASSSVGGDYEHTVAGFAAEGDAYYEEIPQKIGPVRLYDVLVHYTVTPSGTSRFIGQSSIVKQEKCRYHLADGSVELLNRDEGGSLG